MNKYYLPMVKNIPDRMNSRDSMIISAGVKSPNDSVGQKGGLTLNRGTTDMRVNKIDP